ncbi:hypothetical protein BDN72DRAFT_841859 [Pluteus cervinus]|uniref:Uncharacterized protein n=1 Tax=Pluteus cervinus TaxID=181527 RepID=A0ACD3ATW5_9AGAR|nr:hypothetical protein BDN72DRAFT_841859 [Pluteus cervinus]
MKRFEMNCRLPTRMIPAQGRHRPSFKRYDYPKDTPWYAFTSPLPPGIQKSDLRHLWHDMIDKFCKNNWRSEEQTEKAVEELGKTFDGGLLIESPGGAIPFEDMEAALPKSSGERYYDIKLGDGPKPPHASDHSWLGGYGINTTGRAGKTMEDLTLSQLAKNDGEDSKDPTGWYRIYENPSRHPGDPTLQETMQMFMKLWESADLCDEVHCMKVSEEIKELFQHHEIIRLSKSAFHAKLKEDEE